MTFKQEVAELNDRYVRSYTAGDAESCAAVFTDDGIVLQRGTEPIVGRAAIAVALKASLADGLEIYNMITTHCEADGSIGYAVTITDTNQGQERALLAMKRSPEGRWLIHADAVVGNISSWEVQRARPFSTHEGIALYPICLPSWPWLRAPSHSKRR